VDENLRRDRARDFAQKHGTLIIAAVVLFLAAVGGWIYWQGRQKEKAAEQSEQLSQIYTDIGSGKTDNVPQRLDALSDDGNDIVRASALFARASVALQQGDRNLAITKFREAQNDDGLPQAYRDLALVRLTALEFDSLKPEQVIARLQPLATAGNPWFGSAGELTAMALLKQGKKPEAGRLFAAIAADRQVPETMRSRAVQIAGTLGVDASASMPALLQ
jgi:hypothetical protein